MDFKITLYTMAQRKPLGSTDLLHPDPKGLLSSTHREKVMDFEHILHTVVQRKPLGSLTR